MSAHTPGPWGWDSRNSNYYLLTFARDAPHQIVAELKTPRDAMGDADANLIAAAPELLEALKLIVSHFGDPLKVAEAAIAKAEDK